eukprot:gnl/MRDRNA2_/MRDRNA2_105790_c0_seq1.p1 gnl/MRDRNA2_/MRDRNA2_105790_c0~~gnl/MRDRNA2_/MRDRNA2_105790_c0_seq1.p1  ORF type:complete len:322 (+),score=76.54 gnl/MRDRNA2_/MRDRNA2_105790_c0_seq1:113-1078(+)
MAEADTAAADEKPNSWDFDTTPIENDGTVDLILMATEHPEVRRFCASLSDQFVKVTALVQKCTPWSKDPQAIKPQEGMEVFESVRDCIDLMTKDIQSLDNIDLDQMEPGWGDRQTVRLARKQVIAFAQGVEERLDSLLKCLLPHVADWKAKVAKERLLQRETASNGQAQASKRPRSDEEQSSKEAEAGPPGKKQLNSSRAAAQEAFRPTPKVSEIAARVKKLRERTGQQVDRDRAYGQYCEDLASFSANPDLIKDAGLCKSAIETTIASLTIAVETMAKRKSVKEHILKGFDSISRSIEDLKNPEDLRGLMDWVQELLSCF